MLIAIRYARENKVPYFGICLGMQTACIEFARNVVGLEEANSSEFDPATPHRVIYKLRELRGVEELGGTMRLGAWTCKIEPDTLAHKIYGKPKSASAIAIATNSIASTKSRWWRRAAHLRLDAGWNLRRDGRIAGPSAFHRMPVSSRVQIEAAGAASAVQSFIGAAYEHGSKRRAEKRLPRSRCFIGRKK